MINGPQFAEISDVLSIAHRLLIMIGLNKTFKISKLVFDKFSLKFLQKTRFLFIQLGLLKVAATL